MDRFTFLRNAALLAAGAVAADQIEIIQRVEEEEPRQPRRLFPGATFSEYRVAVAQGFFGERLISSGQIIEVESTYPRASWLVKLPVLAPEEKDRIVKTWHNRPNPAVLGMNRIYGARAGGW